MRESGKTTLSIISPYVKKNNYKRSHNARIKIARNFSSLKVE